MPIFTTQVSGSTYTHLSGTISLSGSHYNDVAGALNPPLFQVTGSVGIERNLRVSGSLMVSSSLLISGTARFDSRAGGVQAYFTDKKGHAETQIASSNGGSLRIQHADVFAYGVFAPTVKLYKSRGTLDSPTPLNDGDRIGNIEFWAYDNSWERSAMITVNATANHGDDSTDVPSNMQFFVAEDGQTAYNSTPALTLINSGSGTGGLVAHTGGNLRVGGNEIENSDGETTIIMTADQKVGIGPDPGGSWPSYMLDVNGDIRIRGNDIRNSDGEVTISMDADQNVTIGNDLTVTGNVIRASDGGSTITMDDSDNVTIGNDLTVGGNVIRASDGGSTITMDTSDNVTLAGNLDLAKSGATLLTIGDDSDGDNRKITFGHATCKTVMGIYDTDDKFQIHTGADLASGADFELDNSGNVTIGNGSLYVDGEVWGKGTTQLKLNSNADVIVKVDADNNQGGKKFKVNNHSDTEKFSVSMAGVASAAGAIYAGGNARISGSIYLDDGGMFMGMSSNDLQVTSKGNIEFFVDNDVTTPGNSSFLIYSGSTTNTIPLFAVTEADGVDVGTTLIGGDLKVGQNRILSSDNTEALYLSGSGNVVVKGELEVVGGIVTAPSVLANAAVSPSEDKWIRIATANSDIDQNNKQLSSTFLVTMVGVEYTTTFNADSTFLVHVEWVARSTAPYYDSDGTSITVDTLSGTADLEDFDPSTDVAITFSNSETPTQVDLWMKYNESHRSCYTSILGGTTQVSSNYIIEGFTLLTGQSNENSITSLGQEVYGTWMDKSYNNVHVSKIYSEFPSGGQQVLSFSGSNINSNATNPVSIVGTGTGVTPYLMITSRATGVDSGPEFNMRKYASDGTLVEGENLGEIRFMAATGSAPHGFDDETYENGAVIIAEVGTGTWETGSSPGRLRFFTNEDGSNTLRERLAIESDGEITFPRGGFPGLVIGYTAVDSSALGNMNVTTTMDYIQEGSGDRADVTFTAPPSGNVEIEWSGYIRCTSDTAAWLKMGLTTDTSTFTIINGTRKFVKQSSTFDDEHATYFTTKWIVSSLTPGTSYTYCVGAQAEAADSFDIYWYDYNGGSNDYYPPMTVKATVLPATIST